MSYQLGRNIRYEHPLKTEIYKKGYTICSFADEIGINRATLNNIFTNQNRVRGDTINLIAQGLNTSYERIQKLCN